MFDSTKKDLRDILKRVDEGRIQLPDFQREYVWGDSDVRSLIASIVKGFPVGALLTLQAGSEVAFKPRLLAGVPEKETAHEELLLDGQQRITSLYQAMYSPAPVQTLKRIGGLKKRLIGGDYPRRVLKKIQNTDYLQSCTLLHTMAVRAQKAEQGYKGLELPQISCNRQALLGLPLHAYRQYTETVEKGFVDAAAFLTELRIMSQWDLPYPQQVSALASVFAILGRHAHNAVAKEKLTRWFWCGALGELYGSGGESRMARDVPAIVEWIASNGPPPPTLDDAVFRQNRLLSLRSRKSAAYKAIHALLMAYGCRDFVSGEPVEIMTYFERDIDIHHIFPQKWCKARKLEERHYDCIVNKTPLSKRSNIRMSGDAPSMYLSRIQDKDGIPEPMLDDILTSHQISPALLRENDFDAFFKHRMNALSELIGRAMGKPVVSGQSDEEDWGDDLDEEEDLEAETVSAGD